MLEESRKRTLILKKPDESQLYSSTILNIHLDDEQILYAKSTKKNKFAFF